MSDTELDLQFLFALVIYQGPKVLRRTFLSNWNDKQGEEWEDTAEYGAQYWARETSTAIKRGREPTRSSILAGDSKNWDFTALKWILIDTKVHPLAGDDREHVLYLSKIRNNIAHLKPERREEMRQLALTLDLCSQSLTGLCTKFAPDMVRGFDSHSLNHQKAMFKESPADFIHSIWTEIRILQCHQPETDEMQLSYDEDVEYMNCECFAPETVLNDDT
jgi:hypothetical protein